MDAGFPDLVLCYRAITMELSILLRDSPPTFVFLDFIDPEFISAYDTVAYEPAEAWRNRIGLGAEIWYHGEI